MSFLLGVLLLVSGDSSTAISTTTPPMTAEAPAQATSDADKADKDKKICRREENTESRLGGKRICMTAEQWKRSAQGAQ